MKPLVESEVRAQEEELVAKGGLPALKRTASLGALPGLEAPPEETAGGAKLAAVPRKRRGQRHLSGQLPPEFRTED